MMEFFQAQLKTMGVFLLILLGISIIGFVVILVGMKTGYFNKKDLKQALENEGLLDKQGQKAKEQYTAKQSVTQHKKQASKAAVPPLAVQIKGSSTTATVPPPAVQHDESALVIPPPIQMTKKKNVEDDPSGEEKEIDFSELFDE